MSVDVLYSCGRLARVWGDNGERHIDAYPFGKDVDTDRLFDGDRIGWITLPNHPWMHDPVWQPPKCSVCGRPVLVAHRVCATIGRAKT